MGLLFLGGMINYLDRAALSVAAPFLTKDLALSPAQLGVVFSVFFFGYAAFCFVGGYASDRFGARNVFAVAAVVWSLFCGLTASVFSFTSLLVVRVIFGMGEGPYGSATNKLVSNWFPRRQQATAVGWANAGTPLGGALAGPIVGFIALAWGWRVSSSSSPRSASAGRSSGCCSSPTGRSRTSASAPPNGPRSQPTRGPAAGPP